MEQSKFYTYEITDRTYPRCNVCGAVIADLGQHTAWHLLLSADHPDPDDLPEQVEEPWQEALEKDAQDLVGEWDGLLRSAISLTADAIVQLDGDWETYLECVLFAAIRVRAMAPEGTEWDKPLELVDGVTARGVLKAAIRTLLIADDANISADGRNIVVQLRQVDSYLHGLWLAEQEESE